MALKVMLIEPGGFDTDWLGRSAVHAVPISDYDSLRDARATRSAGVKSGRSHAAILKLVDAENPPLRLLLGKTATQIVPQLYERRLKVWAEWEDVARAVDGD